MKRPAPFLAVAVAAGCLLIPSGCAVFDSGNPLTHSTLRMFRPRPTDVQDPADEEIDPYASVGIEGRGNRPLQDENDPFKPWLMSPKARNIERNLGFK